MNYRYFTFLIERDTIIWQGRERLSDTRKIGHEKRLPDAGKI
jgi:hypothetical protein